jgi:hypothetical protein
VSALDEELAALEAEDEAASAAVDAERVEQAKRDRIAHLKLKKEHGDHKIGVLKLDAYKPGFPTLVVVSALDGSGQRRFEEMISSPSKEKKRQAVRCAVSDGLRYPDEKTFAAMVADFPELPATVAVEAMRLSKAGATEQGKG